MANVNKDQNEKCTDDKIKINDYISINKDNLKDYLHIGWEKLCNIYIHNLISKGREYSLSSIITPAMNATMFKESDHDHTEEKKSSKFYAMMLRNKKQIMTAAKEGVEKVLEENFSNVDHYIQECLLENLGSLRKLIIHRLFCNIVEGLNNEQCYNEYVAMGSTNITSDYDLTIKGSTSNNVMWKMFVKFIDLYGVTLPYAFDTNLYSSPLHLYTQPECLNVTASKKVPFINPNLKKQGYYLEYDTKNFTFVPSNKDEIDMELQFAFLKLSEADSTLEDSTQYSEIQKYIKKTKDLELNKNYVFATEFENMKKNKDINDCIYETQDNYTVIPGGEELIALEVAIRNDNKQGFLSKSLEALSTSFDYTLIDTPPTLNQLTIEGLFCAAGTLIPLQCEYYSLEGVTGLMQTIKTLSEKNMTTNRVIGIVRTMVDMRNNLAKEVSDELEKYFSSLVFNTLIPRNIKLAEAPSHGVSGVKYMPNSYGAKAYLALAGELIRRVENV